MDLRVERAVAFPSSRVYAWWTDFQPRDHGGIGSPARATREIVRREGQEVWLRDRATRPMRMTIDEHVTLEPPMGYTVEARYPGADVRYAYRFEPLDRGTRVVLEVAVRPRMVGRILVPLTAWWWRRYASRDLDYHLARMADDLRE